jgi:hypothetical protein
MMVNRNDTAARAQANAEAIRKSEQARQAAQQTMAQRRIDKR